MSTNYPTTKQTIPNPTSTDLLENATAELDHDYQHATANDTIGALQDKVGMDGSAVTTSHDYKLSGVTGGDKAVSKTGTETLTNKTLTSPQINFGSDAIGDLAYRNGSSTTARLPIGTEAQIMAVSSGVPAWIANPSATTASTTAAGIVELATTAETTTGTDTTRAVTPDGLHDMTSLEGAAWFLDEDDLATDSATKVPSQQSVKAYADNLDLVKKVDVTTTNATVTSTGSKTAFYTVSIPANTLGTNNGIKGTFYFSITTTSSTNKVITLDYGSTDLTFVTMVKSGTDSTTIIGFVNFYLLGAGGTSAQEASMMVNTNEFTGRTSSSNIASSGTATEDSTGALNLVFSITQNTSDTFTMNNAFITTIK